MTISLCRGVVGFMGAMIGCYAAYAVLTYWRYGVPAHQQSSNSRLDRLMPNYEVSEVQRVGVRASINATRAAVEGVSFVDSPLIRAIFALRDVPMRLRGVSITPLRPCSVLEETKALGWRQIGEGPGDEKSGHQIIMGAVTQPWKPQVKFIGLTPNQFTGFAAPDFVKIAWTLEVASIDDSSSEFLTETRVMTTDPQSREKFRRYWACLSPGILLIRYELLRLVKSRAERKADSSTESGKSEHV